MIKEVLTYFRPLSHSGLTRPIDEVKERACSNIKIEL